MRDRNRKVIYVGKAKSLRNRVRSYFQAGSKRSADPKIRGLIRSIEDFDYIVVRTEAEATLSEGRLIKEYRPRYNTSFKDDKRFLLLRLNPRDPWPRLRTCRIRKKDGAEYFGPYASAASARAAKDFSEKHFGIRHCRTRVPGKQDYRHCMADVIRHCSAPCIGKIAADDYRERVGEACAFLRGDRPDVLVDLEAAMQQAADAMKFEKAAALRDTLLLLRRAIKQRATGTKDLQMKREEAMAGVVALGEALGVVGVLPKAGAGPKHIECFDISNISGTFAVASMVVCLDGLPRPQRYRRFRIKTVEGANDPAMMAEAVGRRYVRLRDEGQVFPDLVIVDGGITQLRASKARLKAEGISIPMVGLAKQFEELVWDLTNRRGPVLLPRDSAALHVVTRIRDEAHRFALTYHRSIRARRIRDSQLDEIEGIGAQRKALLLKHFGSVDRLRQASREDLLAVNGIGPAFADLLVASLAKPSAGGDPGGHTEDS